MKPSQRAIFLLDLALSIVEDERHFRDPKDFLACVSLREAVKHIEETVDLLKLVDKPE